MPITTRLLATASLLTFTLLFQVPVHAAPERGINKSLVRSQYGAPTREVASVGQPPISRWIYSDFTVYFEGEHVIHVVQHNRTLATPAPQATTQAPVAAVTVQPAAESAPVATPLPVVQETTAQPEPAAPVVVTAEPIIETAPEPTFRFDPATGRLIQAGAETSQPEPAVVAADPEPVAEEPVEEAAPAEPEPPAIQPEPESAQPEPTPAPVQPAAGSTGLQILDSSGNPIQAEPSAATAPAPVVEEAPAAPAETPAPASNTDTTSDGTRFRFDPVTGKIVIVED